MPVRHLVVVVGLAAAALVLPAAPSYAAGSADVYVTSVGVDNDTCASDTPCATVAAAIHAVADGGRIHVGPGTFDGELRPGALSKSVTITGNGSGGPDATILTATSGGDGYVLEVGSGTTALSNLAIHGGFSVDVLVDGGTVTGDHVHLDDSYCNLAVESGSVTLTDSSVLNGGQGCVTPTPIAEIAISGGDVSLVRTTVGSAGPFATGVSMSGGTFEADQSFFDEGADFNANSAKGVQVSGGTATVSRSTFRGWGFQAIDVTGGSALVSDSTFLGNLVSINNDSGSATVVRSTFQGDFGSLQGPISLAGSVLGTPLNVDCAPTPQTVITDLGYNLSTDATCGFTQTSSQQSVADLNLDTTLADRGGPPGLQTVATFWPSPAVDSIPTGATYGVSATPLCTGTDLRGVPRPRGGACDAGSMELAATVTTLAAPKTAKPHTDVPLVATVVVPDVGVPGIESANGTVTFTAGTAGAGTVLCQDALVHLGEARCTSAALGAGSRTVRATFTPTVDVSTLHGSTVTRTIVVGTTPAFTSKAKTTFVVGRSHTFRVRASGSPSPKITLVKGKLPAGLKLHAGTGTGSATISGTAKASAVGTHSVTVQASNVRGSVRRVLKIVVSRH